VTRRGPSFWKWWLTVPPLTRETLRDRAGSLSLLLVCMGVPLILLGYWLRPFIAYDAAARLLGLGIIFALSGLALSILEFWLPPGWPWTNRKPRQVPERF
jgi:hypothetical protein